MKYDIFKYMSDENIIEYNTLKELVLKSGINNDDIQLSIHEAIGSHLKTIHPEIKDFVIEVDEKAGRVTITSNKKDITPDHFQDKVFQIIRLTLISLLHNNSEDQKSISYKNEQKPWFMRTVFWGYNILYNILIIIFLGFILYPDSNIQESLRFFTIEKALSTCILCLTPIISIILAIILIKKKFHDFYTKLFFIFELPILIFLFVHVAFIQQKSGVIWFFSFAIPITCILLFFLSLNSFNISKRNHVVYLLLQEYVLLHMMYFTVIFSFFVPIIMGQFIKFIIQSPKLQDSYGYFPVLTIFQFFIFSGFFIVIVVISGYLMVFPYYSIYILIKEFLKTWKSLLNMFTTKKLVSYVGIFALFIVIGVIILSYQQNPQPYVDETTRLLQSKTFNEKQIIAKSLFRDEKNLKTMLIAAIYPFDTYFFSASDNIITQMYKMVFDLDEKKASIIGNIFIKFAYPLASQVVLPSFVNNGKLPKYRYDQDIYQYLFNTSSYINRPDYDLFNQQSSRPVLIKSRTIDAQTIMSGAFAQITFTEEYVNTSSRQIEITHDFSLSQEATIIDLRLGPSLEYKGIVAPRGSAERVYNQEVNKFLDPALIQQTGPRQYNLRVFPIPARGDVGILKGINQKVQFTYLTPVTKNGFKLPFITKSGNIRDAEKTKATYTLDKKAIHIEDGNGFIPYDKHNIGNICNISNSNILQSKLYGSSMSAMLISHMHNSKLITKGTCTLENGFDVMNSIYGTKMLLLIDISYSKKIKPLLVELVGYLKSNSFIDKNDLQVMFFNDSYSDLITINRNNLDSFFDVTSYGASNIDSALSRVTASYDAVILVSNLGELNTFYLAPAKLNAKYFYLIQPDDELVTSMNESIRARFYKYGVQSVDDVASAIQSFSLSHELEKTDNYIYVGPYWGITLKAIKENEKMSTNSALVSFTNRQRIFQELKNADFIRISDIAFLDKLHSYSRDSSFISPYSSLLALVNENQMRNLKEQNKNIGRYDSILNRSPSPITIEISERSLGFSTLSFDIAFPIFFAVILFGIPLLLGLIGIFVSSARKIISRRKG